MINNQVQVIDKNNRIGAMSGEVGATSEDNHQQQQVVVKSYVTKSNLMFIHFDYFEEDETYGRGRLLQLSQHKWANQTPPQVADQTSLKLFHRWRL